MSNRFENKSKLTLFIVLALSFVVLLVVFEKLLGMSLGHTEEVTRHIRLRENSPNMNLQLTPSAAILKRSENVENKAYAFKTDRNGFLLPFSSDIDTDPNKKADLTLAFIGGSTTECMFVDAEKRFPYLTGKLLNNTEQNVVSINAGVSGNDSLNSINSYLNKIVPLKPDIAILMHNINDISTLLHEGSYWNNNDYRSNIVYEDKSLKTFLKAQFPNSFELLHRVKSMLSPPVDEFSNERGKTKTVNSQRIYDAFEDNLNIFISISKAKGIKPVLMTQANRLTEKPDPIVADSFKALESLDIDYQQFKQLFDGMNNKIRQVAEENNIFFIDLAKEIPPNKEFIVDTVHYNNKGSELVAQVISERLTAFISQTTTN